MCLATCPVCNGTTRIAAGETPYKRSIAGYDLATDTLTCNNCGGQTMYGVATGKVQLNAEGVPCTHKYTCTQISRSRLKMSCTFCTNCYVIDSGD